LYIIAFSVETSIKTLPYESDGPLRVVSLVDGGCDGEFVLGVMVR
jgi:hypothetical protein